MLNSATDPWMAFQLVQEDDDGPVVYFTSSKTRQGLQKMKRHPTTYIYWVSKASSKVKVSRHPSSYIYWVSKTPSEVETQFRIF